MIGWLQGMDFPKLSAFRYPYNSPGVPIVAWLADFCFFVYEMPSRKDAASSPRGPTGTHSKKDCNLL
jgi:hypothetical protein